MFPFRNHDILMLTTYSVIKLPELFCLESFRIFKLKDYIIHRITYYVFTLMYKFIS